MPLYLHVINFKSNSFGARRSTLPTTVLKTLKYLFFIWSQEHLNFREDVKWTRNDRPAATHFVITGTCVISIWTEARTNTIGTVFLTFRMMCSQMYLTQSVVCCQLKAALTEASKNSSMLLEYRELYELQRQRLETQVSQQADELLTWCNTSYCLAGKVCFNNHQPGGYRLIQWRGRVTQWLIAGVFRIRRSK